MIESLNLAAILQLQKEYFARQYTKPYKFRAEMLRSLSDVIEKNEERLIEAMQADMGKPALEAAASEIWFVQEEIRYALKNLKHWMRPQRVRTPLLHFWSASRIYPEPYGQVLIIAPWNYPFNLLFGPLVGALAAGNTAILKPSELTPATAQVMEEMINQNFDPGYVHVENGAAEVAQRLLQLPFNYIFFTGGTRIGKIVMQAAAEQLIPVTLELGGKSPVIVEESADLDVAAERIVWGKFFNAGQTCIAPDYVLVQQNVQAVLVEKLKAAITAFYGSDPQSSPDYARIVSAGHFQRLLKLIDPGKMVCGGQSDPATRYIAPTILNNVELGDAAMGEEIFGPILPVISYESLEQAIQIVQQNPNPLSLYVFTRDHAVEKEIITRIPFGGGCVNDVLSQFVSAELPFGGRGASGMGAYHGKHTFETFTHSKAVIQRANWPEIPLRFPPYKINLQKMKKIFKLANWSL